MLKLDGAALDMSGREFTYTLPKPFGPDRGEAVLIVVARPAASQNATFRAELDKILHKAKVRDLVATKAYEKSDDEEQLVTTQDDNTRWLRKAIAELQFDHCIIEWSSTIQNEGQDIDPTRENFIALSQFEHPDLRKVFDRLQKDLTNFDNFSVEAVEQALEDEAKNLPKPSEGVFASVRTAN